MVEKILITVSTGTLPTLFSLARGPNLLTERTNDHTKSSFQTCSGIVMSYLSAIKLTVCRPAGRSLFEPNMWATANRRQEVGCSGDEMAYLVTAGRLSSSCAPNRS